MNWLRALGIAVFAILAIACGPASNTSTPATPETIRQETDQETRDRVAKQLEEDGYKRTPAGTSLPANFTNNNGDMVHMSAEYPSGQDYIVITFGDGRKARCDQPGIGAAGINPVGEIKHLRELGYDKVVGGTEQPACKAV